jgi:hypothetical protein
MAQFVGSCESSAPIAGKGSSINIFPQLDKRSGGARMTLSVAHMKPIADPKLQEFQLLVHNPFDDVHDRNELRVS